MRTVVAGLVECRSHLYQAARDKFALGASSPILATLLYFAFGHFALCKTAARFCALQSYNAHWTAWKNEHSLTFLSLFSALLLHPFTFSL